MVRVGAAAVTSTRASIDFSFFFFLSSCVRMFSALSAAYGTRTGYDGADSCSSAPLHTSSLLLHMRGSTIQIDEGERSEVNAKKPPWI